MGKVRNVIADQEAFQALGLVNHLETVDEEETRVKIVAGKN